MLYDAKQTAGDSRYKDPFPSTLAPKGSAIEHSARRYLLSQAHFRIANEPINQLLYGQRTLCTVSKPSTLSACHFSCSLNLFP